MTTWKDGGDYGRLCRAIVNEAGSCAICHVWTKRNAKHRGGGIDGSGTEPYSQGGANFRLILQAPRMLEALEEMQAAMSTALSVLSYLPTATDDLLGSSTARQVERAIELSKTVLATVAEPDEF